MYAACLSGHLEVVEWLSQLDGVDPCAVNGSGCTPFYAAAFNGHVPVLAFLVDQLGVDVQETHCIECTPLYAVRYLIYH